jgi:hypothetical protein
LAMANLSHNHAAIIEDAKIYGNPRVKFTEGKEGIHQGASPPY